MRSPRAVVYERIRGFRPRKRYVDIAARIRVFRRGDDGRAKPAELLDRVYGGRWDSIGKRYAGPAETWVELPCHPGQIPALTYDKKGVSHVLVLGAPGGGKTEVLVTAAVLCALDNPDWYIGLIAPTQNRRQILWDKFLRICQPNDWIKNVRWSENRVTMVTGARVLFLATKRQSGSNASPVAGLDLHAAFADEQQDMEDEDLEEIDARGRVNKDFRLLSSATNERRGQFQRRLQKYRTRGDHEILRIRGDENSFTPLEHWERLRSQWSKEAYNRKVLALDEPSPKAVYPSFSMEESLQPIPQVGRDITTELTRSKFDPNGDGYRYIVGSDFGVLTTVSHVYRVFMVGKERLWWAIDEIVTKNKPAQYHVEEVLERYPASGSRAPFLMISMPHVNAGAAGQTEQHDFNQVRAAGVRIVQASPTKISRKHRHDMVDAMLGAADGKRRLFIATDGRGNPLCPLKVDSFLTLEYGVDGNPNDFKKTERDLTHYTDTDGYALYPWEKFRGSSVVRVAGSGARRGSA